MENGNSSDFYTATQEPAAPKAVPGVPSDYYSTPQAAPAAPAAPQGDYYSTPHVDTTAVADMTHVIATAQDLVPFAKRHPIINALVVEPIKDVSALVYHGLRSGASGRMPSPYGQEAASQEINKYIAAQDPAEIERAQRGFALVASFLPAGKAVSIATALKFRWFGRVASFLAGEAAGGAIYGAIAPTEPGQSRAESVVENAAAFAVVGGIVGGAAGAAAMGYRKYILGNLGAAGVARAVAKLAEVKAALAKAGTSMDGLPPAVRAQILENAYRETVEELEANADKVKGFIANEVAGAGEASEASGAVKSILPSPEEPFAFAEPLEPPKGFLPGAEQQEMITSAAAKVGNRTFTGVEHSDALDAAVAAGAAKTDELGNITDETFEQATFGFMTNKGRFIARDEADRLGLRAAPGSERAMMESAVPGYVGREFVERQVGDILKPEGLEPTAAGVEGKFRPRRKPPKGFEPTATATSSRPADVPVRAAGPGASQASTMQELGDRLREPGYYDAAPPGIPPEALGDVAVQDAVDRTKPLEVASPDVRSAAAEVKAAPAASVAAPEPLTQIGAPWEEKVAQTAAPAVDGLEAAARMTDDELKGLQREFMRLAHATPEAPRSLDVIKDEMQKIGAAEAEFAREWAKRVGEVGAVSARLLPAVVGAGVMVGASNTDDPGKSKSLWALGALLVAASLHAPIRGFIATSGKERYGSLLAELLRKFTKKLVLNANPAILFANAGAKAGAREYIETRTSSREMAHGVRTMLENVFDKNTYRAAMISVDEMDAAAGTFPAEFHQLSAEQQQTAIASNQFNKRLEQLMEQNGATAEFVENYARRVLPDETYQRWLTKGYRLDRVTGERVRLGTVREMEAFAQANALPEPVLKMPDIQALRITEAFNSIGNARMRAEMARLGLVVDAPKIATDVMPEGWRVINILGMRNKIAPDAVAKALENISSSGASRNDVVSAVDALKSMWMRSIMFWSWEHGLNVLRALPLVAMNPAGFARAWDAVSRNDPSLMEAAQHGLNLRARTDYGLRSAKAFEEMARRVGNIPLIGSMWRAGGNLVEKQDRFLWDQIVPSLQLFGYQNEMHKWAERTGGRLLPGGPEYVAAARKAADFANAIAGRIPTEMMNPKLAQTMRLVMFSPGWTTSRIALTIGAAGELGEIAAGRLNPAHAMYLPGKIRQVAVGVALTWIGSRLLSGKDPEFNPNTSRFYMRTGLRNENGREVGIDLAGWWQDDVKLLSSPFNYIGSRLNPALKVAGETVTGRDYLGRDMTFPQRLGNIIHSLGPPSEAVDLAARVGQTLAPGGAPRMTGGEAASRISGATGIGNVAALPRPIDAAIGRYAAKLLDRMGLPQNDYLVFELSRLLRGNLLSGQPLIDNRVMTYLAYRRRSLAVHEPITALWQETRRALADF